MRDAGSHWWGRLAIQKKVWIVLLLVVAPMVVLLVGHLALIRTLLDIQATRHQTIAAREHIQELRRVAIDIEEAFRAYLLTQDETFRSALAGAEGKIRDRRARARTFLAERPVTADEVDAIAADLESLLMAKQRLIGQVAEGQLAQALDHLRAGPGLHPSDQVRGRLRAVEDGLDQQLVALERDAADLSAKAFWGLVAVVGLGVLLGAYAVRQLARSVTGPLETLRTSFRSFSSGEAGTALAALRTIRSQDEVGELARSSEVMIRQTAAQIHELQILHDVGLDITTIQPDGVDGVVQRIADQAAALLTVDVCLILSRNEMMGCWIVEAASGAFAERMKKTVMLWEELPLSIQAYETRQPAIGEHLREDVRPELVRRNLIGDSMLVVPLLSRGVSFGVMAFLTERALPRDAWNVRMAESLAGAAAVAIVNARLYETANRKEQQTRERFRQLEHLGEMLAHDLKGPAERMGQLATLVRRELADRATTRADRFLELIERNGREVSQRVEQVLSLARVGGRQQSLEVVDPNVVVDDILKARAGEWEAGQIRLVREPGLMPVACHRAYVYQVFDNLLSNALKFARGADRATILIGGRREGGRQEFRITDNGPGIPLSQQERVFDPFVRLNPAAAEGTGIGLAIVRRIVELYGGRVWVDPTHTPGCCIRFTLPLIGALRDSPVDRVEAGGPSPALPVA